MSFHVLKVMVESRNQEESFGMTPTAFLTPGSLATILINNLRIWDDDFFPSFVYMIDKLILFWIIETVFGQIFSFQQFTAILDLFLFYYFIFTMLENCLFIIYSMDDMDGESEVCN